MNDNDKPPETRETPVRHPGAMRPVSRWVVAAPSIALVLGILLGGSLVWLTTNDSSPITGDEQDEDTSESSPSPATAVVVPDACLEAADSVREATELLRAGLDDVRSFRAEALIDLLNDLEDLDRQARAQAETCSEVQITDAPLSSPTAPTTDPSAELPSPTTDSPTGSPTS